MIDNLLNSFFHTHSHIRLDNLPKSPLSEHVRNFLMAYQVEDKSPRTIENYKMVLTPFLAFLGNRKPDSYEIRSFLASLNGKLGPHSRHIYYKCLKRFFNWLVEEEITEKNPMKNIKPAKLPEPVIKPHSQANISKILELCSGHRFADYRNKAIVLVFLDTWLRLSELANIQLNDIDPHSGLITVMGKGRKQRVVRIGKSAQRALMTYLMERARNKKDDYPCLWLNVSRRPLSKGGVQTIIDRLSQRAGITDAKHGPHTFRHTGATMALRNGANPFDVQSLLGHSTLNMTRRYTKTVNSEDAVRNHQKFSPVDNMKLK